MPDGHLVASGALMRYLQETQKNDLQHIKKIVAAYKARKDVDKYAHVSAFDEIKENDFNLNIPRYVDTFEEEKEIDIADVQKEIDQLEGELVEVRAKMKKYLKELGVR